MTYADKLRDPRWQRKRLEVLNSSDFMCRDCGAKDKTLHVHHAYYEMGRDPWDYPDMALIPVCEECHESRQAQQNYVLMLLANFDPATIFRVQGYLVGVWITDIPDSRSDALAPWPVPVGQASARGFLDATGVAVFCHEENWTSLEYLIEAFDSGPARHVDRSWATAESVCP